MANPNDPTEFPDAFGLTPIPLAPPEGDEPVSDPALMVLLSYLKAFLTTDQNASLAWQVKGVSPSNPPVLGIFPWDPEENLFNANNLPALFLWREDGTDEWMADDYFVTSDTLKMLWVFPGPGTPENQAIRVPFANGIGKAIKVAIERGRTPSWKQPDDDDPVAETEGSFLGKYLGGWSLFDTRWRRTHVVEKSRDGNRTYGTYPAIEIQWTLMESWDQNIDNPARTAPTSATNGVDFTTTTSTGATSNEGYLANTPKVD